MNDRINEIMNRLKKLGKELYDKHCIDVVVEYNSIYDTVSIRADRGRKGFSRSITCDSLKYMVDLNMIITELKYEIYSAFEIYFSPSDLRDNNDYRRIATLYTKPFSKKLKKNPYFIKDVIFNDPATIVFWSDGTKTVVKAQDGEPYDPEKGLAMAISKKCLGNDYEYYNTFLHYLKKCKK